MSTEVQEINLVAANLELTDFRDLGLQPLAPPFCCLWIRAKLRATLEPL